MSVKVCSRTKYPKDSFKLQAIKDFSAAEVCLSDGESPLSFHVGEIFTFIQERDENWVKVERELWKNDALLKIGEYPATERGVVPLNYVAAMNPLPEKEENEIQIISDNSDLSTSELNNESILQLKRDKAELARQLQLSKKRLDDSLKENTNLQTRSKKEYGQNLQLMHQLLQQYYAIGEMLVTTKEEVAIAQQSLIEEQQKSQKCQDLIDEIKQQISKSGNKSAIKLVEKIIQKEEKKDQKSQPNGIIHGGRTERNSSIDEQDLKLSCTLCAEKIRISDLSNHSKVCSSQAKTKTPKTPPTPSTDMFRVTVTCSEADEKNATFTVVTKTNMPDYEHTLYEVHRSETDFEWLRKALEESCPERVIPRLISHSSLNGKTRELQRFLSRILAHKILRHHTLLKLFLTGSNDDVRNARDELDKRQQKISSTAKHKPVKRVCDENAALVKCQRYLERLSTNLEGLIKHLGKNVNKKSAEGVGHWFKTLADGEPTETYLKNTSTALGKICDELDADNRQSADEKLIVSDLESVLEYTRSALTLLQRVETAVDNFLYWDEEVKAYEQMKDTGAENPETNSHQMTQKWAEANSSCAEAKAKLEMMCQDLSNELGHFDLRKERELREFFMEYSDLRSEYFEKVQSKWFGIKFLVEAPISVDVRAIKCVEEST